MPLGLLLVGLGGEPCPPSLASDADLASPSFRLGGKGKGAKFADNDAEDGINTAGGDARGLWDILKDDDDDDEDEGRFCFGALDGETPCWDPGRDSDDDAEAACASCTAAARWA